MTKLNEFTSKELFEELIIRVVNNHEDSEKIVESITYLNDEIKIFRDQMKIKKEIRNNNMYILIKNTF